MSLVSCTCHLVSALCAWLIEFKCYDTEEQNLNTAPEYRHGEMNPGRGRRRPFTCPPVKFIKLLQYNFKLFQWVYFKNWTKCSWDSNCFQGPWNVQFFQGEEHLLPLEPSSGRRSEKTTPSTADNSFLRLYLHSAFYGFKFSRSHFALVVAYRIFITRFGDKSRELLLFISNFLIRESCAHHGFVFCVSSCVCL